MIDKEKIIGVLRRFADMERCYEMEEIADAIIAEIKPFSEIIIEQNCFKRRCSLGQWHCSYPFRWRKEYIPVLKLFEGGAMTTAEVGKHFMGQTARKCPSELVSFGVLSVCGTRKGNTLYRLTDTGRGFLDGNTAIPDKVWAEDAPAECQNGTPRYIHEMTATHHGTDRAAHLEEACIRKEQGVLCA